MFKVGTVCVKTAGRDAGKTCVVVEELGQGMVLVEGETRRRKVNVKHLEPVATTGLKKGASHDDVMEALGKEPRKAKPKKAAAKPSATRKVKPKDAPKAAKGKK